MLPIADTVQRRHVPWMTWSLIAVNLWVFLCQILMSREQLDVFVRHFALVPAAQLPLSWITHMFLHVGLAHLVGNLWFLWLFGDDVEDRMGPFRFLVFYLLCGLAAAGMHVKTFEHSQLPMLGASGAIAGVMGAYLLMFPRARILAFGGPFGTYAVPAVVYLALWFLLQFVHGWSELERERATGVAWWSHVGGFMTGFLLVNLFVRRDRWSRAEPGYTDSARDR
jgi:membrane associated rhomboid family serine protease